MLLALPILFLFLGAALWFGRAQRLQSTAHAAARHAAFHDGRESNMPDAQPDYTYRRSPSAPRPEDLPAGTPWSSEPRTSEPWVTDEVLQDGHFGSRYAVAHERGVHTSRNWMEEHGWQGTVSERLGVGPLSDVLSSSNQTTRSSGDLGEFSRGALSYEGATVRTDFQPWGSFLPGRLRVRSRVVVLTDSAPDNQGASARPWFEPLAFPEEPSPGSAPHRLFELVLGVYPYFLADTLLEIVRQVIQETVGGALPHVRAVFEAWFPADPDDEAFK